MTPPRALAVVLATSNAHKVAEFRALAAAAAQPWEILGAEAAGGMPPVDESAPDFAGNALLKARALRARAPAGAAVLADDSGLCVEALGGQPGVHSARYAGPGATSAANNAKLLAALAGLPHPRRAHFACALAWIAPDGAETVAEGRCHGRLLDAPRGAAGFGYDPLFVPDGHDATFAELGDAVKNALSHRARAWAALLAQLAGAVFCR